MRLLERGQSNKLQIRETGFEHNVGGDMEFNRVLSDGQLIEEVPRGNCESIDSDTLVICAMAPPISEPG